MREPPGDRGPSYGLRGRRGSGRRRSRCRPQGGGFGNHPVILQHRADGISGKIVIRVRLLLTDHVQMSLQHHRGMPFPAGAGRLTDQEISAASTGLPDPAPPPASSRSRRALLPWSGGERRRAWRNGTTAAGSSPAKGESDMVIRGGAAPRKRQTPAATDTLRLSTAPNIGMRTSVSQVSPRQPAQPLAFRSHDPRARRRPPAA